MDNPVLETLNFANLLQYNLNELQLRGAQTTYDPALACTGFCVLCEQHGCARVGAPNRQGNTDPTLISHACDSSDYEAILGPIADHLDQHEIPRFDHPVLFLLKDPGGDWGAGQMIPFNGILKRVPIKHYYWAPHNITHWPANHWRGLPRCASLYGDYFAYLMVRYGLTNVYITNLRKCKWGSVRNAHIAPFSFL